jgi:hypothetical protein
MENKKVSVIIGCAMGMVVFVGIIISILVIKPKSKDDDIVVPVEAPGHKTPKSRSGSLVAMHATKVSSRYELSPIAYTSYILRHSKHI